VIYEYFYLQHIFTSTFAFSATNFGIFIRNAFPLHCTSSKNISTAKNRIEYYAHEGSIKIDFFVLNEYVVLQNMKIKIG